MNGPYIIKHAILSEKAFQEMNIGRYTFLIDRKATKSQVAKAVKDNFGVDVVKVKVMNRPFKQKKITGTRKTIEVSGGKKAVVYLKPGQKISILSPKTEQTTKPKKQKTVKTKVVTEEKSGIISKLTSSKKREEKKLEAKSGA